MSRKFWMCTFDWYEPASISKTRQCGTSDNLDATTEPPDPPPTTMKSYSFSGAARLYNQNIIRTLKLIWSETCFLFLLNQYITLGRLHGSSKSHCERKNTSSKPMNSINWPPPQVDASVGPIGTPTGQSQSAMSGKFAEKTIQISY